MAKKGKNSEKTKYKIEKLEKIMVTEKGKNSEEINNKVGELDKSMATQKKLNFGGKDQERRQCSGRRNAITLEIITEVYYQHDVVPRQSQQL